MICRRPSLALSVVVLLAGPGLASGFDDGCDLALVIALDVSKSMDTTEFTLEFEGTANALRHPAVQSAILEDRNRVVITAFEWSGQSHQAMVAEWSVLREREDIDTFAATLELHDRGGRGKHTGTGSALEFAYELLADGPGCARSVIDISSDGYSNDGMTPREFLSTAPPGPVTVNALVVGGKKRPLLWRYFRSDVIYGPGAFAMATQDFEDYQQAMAEKLLREIRPPALAATSD